MNVKSTFLNGFPNEEVYVAQQKGFVDAMCIMAMSTSYKRLNPKALPLHFISVSRDDSGDKVAESLYKSIIESLLYLIASGTDIAFAVDIYARYHSDPCFSHLYCAKHILKLGQMLRRLSKSEDSRRLDLWTLSVLGHFCSNLLRILFSFLQAQHFKSIPARNPLKRLRRLGDIDAFALPRTKVSSLKHYAPMHASFVPSSNRLDTQGKGGPASVPQASTTKVSGFYTSSSLPSSKATGSASGSPIVLEGRPSTSISPFAFADPPNVSSTALGLNFSTTTQFVPTVGSHAQSVPKYASSSTIPPISTMGSSSIPKESVRKWKYVVQHQIADELNISNKHLSGTLVIELIQNDGANEFQKVHVHGVCFTVSPALINYFLGVSLPADFTACPPSPEQLAVELSGSTVCSWPIDDPIDVKTIVYVQFWF
ncbi:flocculation protein FLO11-like [Cucumis melo var. makuwa]|uniref:Flocculation protein FLO11-like n=1 Tax=Cucumis melo var. makuwa TaxID=1194695 RepID=A0A5D3DV16_CUCMM|nr:flocculation protein FLO11-like [Cucumis melo var. makuwa]TYK27209.1 flocculation protein FLO11-like [Cucumis melo var. makuwa]